MRPLSPEEMIDNGLGLPAPHGAPPISGPPTREPRDEASLQAAFAPRSDPSKNVDVSGVIPPGAGTAPKYRPLSPQEMVENGLGLPPPPGAPAKPTSFGEAARRGATMMGTAGFADEMAAGGQSLMQKAANVAGHSKFGRALFDALGIESRYEQDPGEVYDSTLQEERAADAKAKHDRPVTYGVAGALGGAATAAAMAPTAGVLGTGAVLGGLGGAGYSEETEPLKVGRDALMGAGIGAATAGIGSKFPKMTSGAMIGAAAFNPLKMAPADRVATAFGGALGLGLGAIHDTGKAAGRGAAKATAAATAEEAAQQRAAWDQIKPDPEGLKRFNAAADSIDERQGALLKAVTAEAKRAHDERLSVKQAADKSGSEAFAARQSRARDAEKVATGEGQRAQASAKAAGGNARREYLSLVKNEAADIAAAEEARNRALATAGRASTPPADESSAEAAALGKLGAEAQEAYRYLRSKGDLGLNLGEDAQKGIAALVPDYEAQANEKLAKFANGKGALLQELIAAERAQRTGRPPLAGEVTEVGAPPAEAFRSSPGAREAADLPVSAARREELRKAAGYRGGLEPESAPDFTRGEKTVRAGVPGPGETGELTDIRALSQEDFARMPSPKEDRFDSEYGWMDVPRTKVEEIARGQGWSPKKASEEAAFYGPREPAFDPRVPEDQKEAVFKAWLRREAQHQGISLDAPTGTGEEATASLRSGRKPANDDGIEDTFKKDRSGERAVAATDADPELQYAPGEREEEASTDAYVREQLRKQAAVPGDRAAARVGAAPQTLKTAAIEGATQKATGALATGLGLTGSTFGPKGAVTGAAAGLGLGALAGVFKTAKSDPAVRAYLLGTVQKALTQSPAFRTKYAAILGRAAAQNLTMDTLERLASGDPEFAAIFTGGSKK